MEMPEAHTAQRIVVVVDMVGYTRMAQLLEENAGAGAVAELNRQIQTLVQSGVAALPAGAACLTLAETGDGAILLFDLAHDAHLFAEQVLTNANTHNQSRTNKSAMRWFRIGIASGELTRMHGEEAEGGYAGMTIANATRLETAAAPGEIVIDLATYEALPAEARKCYGSEGTVRGKRSEVFRVRKYKVVATKKGSPVQLSRRAMLGLAAGVTGAAALGGWMKFGNASRLLHPLPLKRFVALHLWPKPAEDVAALVNQLVGSIEERLTRAEPRDKHFMVMVPDDPLFAASGSAAPGHEPAEVASALGANLVLATNLQRTGQRLNLTLRLLDPATQSVLRHQELESDMGGVGGLGRFAAEAAASLLDLPRADDHVLADDEEVSGMNPEAYQLLASARSLVETPNDAGLEQGIEQLQNLVNKYPRFAIGYAELANAYLTKFQATQDLGILELAKRNTKAALGLNRDSARGILSEARADVFQGQTDAALSRLNDALRLDPMNPEVLLYKAATFRTLGRFADEEAVYREITANRPNYWVAYNELGGVLKTEAKYNEAIEAYRTASQIAPKVAMPLMNLGIVYLQTGENEKGRTALERSIAIHPTDIAYVGLGDLAFEAGNYKLAIASYNKAHELNPKDSGILRDLGDCYSMTREPGKVKEAFEQAALLLADQLKINGKDGSAWMTLSFYHAKVGRFEEASKEVATAEKQGATDVESQLTKAQTVLLMGHRDEALEIVLKCMDRGLSPANVDLAVDLKDIRNDPRYKARLEHKS